MNRQKQFYELCEQNNGFVYDNMCHEKCNTYNLNDTLCINASFINGTCYPYKYI